MKRCAIRILLVEDDPVSQAYLAAVLETLPATVDAVASAAAAVRAAAGGRGHDLWLVDARLPDADGATLLARLRILVPWTPAVAHTASSDRGQIEALSAAGFDRVLCKPIGATVLRAAVHDALHPAARVAEAWNDGVALAAMRNVPGNVDALRRMFRRELPLQRDAVLAALAADELVAADDVLHRLRASCGFVGAMQLDAAVRALQRAPHSAAALGEFTRAVAALLRQA